MMFPTPPESAPPRSPHLKKWWIITASYCVVMISPLASMTAFLLAWVLIMATAPMMAIYIPLSKIFSRETANIAAPVLYGLIFLAIFGAASARTLRRTPPGARIQTALSILAMWLLLIVASVKGFQALTDIWP